MVNLIATKEISTYHDVEYTFINSLGEAGLVKLKVIKKDTYIPETELQKLEKMIRMHHELDINVAGIEAIIHLLDRVEHMQEELRMLRNRVR
ncbi:chaperone modulator CbpM [Mucilaginibacter sp. OK098]|uniref:chaperone modulator CbpM n=1 Tax=Mucilaginibacter sp. OK098 TaxID=1855297 RepID=UPI000915BD8A|nr:chaperone modulator CbpM [Mucilaginibacter sp. OK098]SHN11025.1 MerR HTH family regulatory protein [Mucilaginibacter sp. OK098]